MGAAHTQTPRSTLRKGMAQPVTTPFEPDDAAAVCAWTGRQQPPTVRAVRVNAATEDEWLAARLGTVGASEIAAIVGQSTYTSPYALWWQKKLDWRLPRTEGQRWGHLVEDPIAELFAEQMADTLLVVKPVGAPYSLWCDPDRPWMTCTPDRLAVAKGSGVVCPVELKSDEGGTGWGEPGSADVPPAHHMQGMWQAAIFGAPGAYIVRKRGSGKGSLAWYWVTYSPDEVAWAVREAQAFLASIEADDPPEPDGSKATTRALQEINPAIDAGEFADVPAELFDEWTSARRHKRDAVAREALSSNKLRAAMGRAEFAMYPARDDVRVVFAKRRIGKRKGYEVGPGMTDELREIGSGERSEVGGVRASVDADAGPQVEAQGPGGLGDPGVGVGGAEVAGAGPEGAGGDAVSFTCPDCGRTSHHPVDEAEKYCGACHTFPHDDRGADVDEVFRKHADEFMRENDEVMRRLSGGLAEKLPPELAVLVDRALENRWYLAWCEDCTPVLPMPFETDADRHAWAVKHQDTGHGVRFENVRRG